MSDFSINEMQEMQKALQEKYKQKWEPICPATGQNKLLWMIGEVGEVIDIVKKNGAADAVEKEDLRKHLVEEMADVLMYCNSGDHRTGIRPEHFGTRIGKHSSKNHPPAINAGCQFTRHPQ